MKSEKLKKLEEMKRLMEKRNKLIKEQKMLEPAYGVATLLEGELERAELILAARDVVNRLQDQAERLGKMSIEDIMPLVDNMKGEFSSEEADAFDQAANESLKIALEAIKTAREQINSNILRMEGKLSDEDVTSINTDMGMDDGSAELDLSSNAGEMASDEVDLGQGQAPAESGDIFGGDDAAAGPAEEALGRSRKESVDRRGPALTEAKKKVIKEAEKAKDAYEADLFEALGELIKTSVAPDSLEAELIANRYGFEITEITEACKNRIQEEHDEEVKEARTPGSAIRFALGINEDVNSALANVVKSNAENEELSSSVPAVKSTAEKQEDAEENAEAMADASPQDVQKAVKDLGSKNAQELKNLMKESSHMIIEDILEINEVDMIGHIKSRIANIGSSKSISIKETFGHDIKLGTPRAVVKQLAEKYGDPQTWQVARTDEGSHYIISGAIAEEMMAKDTQKQITSLEEEVVNVRKKHNDVQEQYKLPQEFKLDTLRERLQEYNTGYQHQVAKWLSLEEARSIVEMAQKWTKKK